MNFYYFLYLKNSGICILLDVTEEDKQGGWPIRGNIV
jgi:hypothetical protein